MDEMRMAEGRVWGEGEVIGCARRMLQDVRVHMARLSASKRKVIII